MRGRTERRRLNIQTFSYFWLIVLENKIKMVKKKSKGKKGNSTAGQEADAAAKNFFFFFKEKKNA